MNEKLVQVVLPNLNKVEEPHIGTELPSWQDLMFNYGVPFGGYCAGMMYTLYLRMSLTNVGIFMLKYAPMAIYLYKLVKDVFISSRQKITLKQTELEDIQQQIQITNTKLYARDASLEARARSVRQAAERLRRVRARVRALIATDDELKHALDKAAKTEPVVQDDSEEDQDLLNDLLKEFQCVEAPHRQTNKNCGEPNDATPEDSVYSETAAQGEDEAKNDCQVKIVKVTNVYKVAYLRHYIKQKRLRRASKQALLKSKVETIKNLFDEWQKALTMVINTKLSMYKMTPSQLDDASQEAMGDFSKPNLCSDSENELRTNEVYFEEVWTECPYKNVNYRCDYDDVPESPRGIYEKQECSEGRMATPRYPFECSRPDTNTLFALKEETISEIAIEEIRNEDDNNNKRMFN